MASEPTEDEVRRAAAALMPFVHAWKLPLNPEEVQEMAGAVLRHMDDHESWEEIDAAVTEQIAGFAAKQEAMTVAFQEHVEALRAERGRG